MEQVVTVRSLYPDGTAEVVCRRRTACSGNCDGCGGCSEGGTPEVAVRAKNPIGARPGDRVIVESGSAGVLGAAVTVYLLPLLPVFVGYWLARGWGVAAGLALGLALILVLDRRRARRGDILYTISAFADGHEKTMHENPN